MAYYKPIDIARELNISTSALRHYESWGVVPAPERAENGYRLYTKEHLAYFRCLRALSSGFGFKLTSDVLRHIQNGDMDAAFWLISEAQSELNHEKAVADKTLALLENPELPVLPKKKTKSHMTIGEVATLAEVEPSAIRHWEKEGLISPDRNPENGYRIFTNMHLRQILMIRTLRNTVYYLENMKDIVQAVEHHRLSKVKKVTEDALIWINDRNRKQFAGVHQLMELCRVVGLSEENHVPGCNEPLS